MPFAASVRVLTAVVKLQASHRRRHAQAKTQPLIAERKAASLKMQNSVRVLLAMRELRKRAMARREDAAAVVIHAAVVRSSAMRAYSRLLEAKRKSEEANKRAAMRLRSEKREADKLTTWALQKGFTGVKLMSDDDADNH